MDQATTHDGDSNDLDQADTSEHAGLGVRHDDDPNEMDQADAYEHADHDYLDDMNDREIILHEEMYGEI
ncbi:hypothetical protein EST38_g11226 [Candolleomyces aberdarensis]|uniref:Uncharacterized protein n=1 Tax=Candolleomyces aberdarensis TaxID=2316362 RepID=A0A4Q2D8N2_9AGAR|nr:hypothetical protein EST38_g11226 [Candolleomyces aberdarensis]